MVVVELCEEVVEFRRVLGFEGTYHSCLEKLAEGLGFLHRRQQPQAPANLVFVHVSLPHRNRLQNNEGAGEIASLFTPRMGAQAVYAVYNETLTVRKLHNPRQSDGRHLAPGLGNE